MIMKAVAGISMALALTVLLGLLPAAKLTLSAAESPEAAAACTGGKDTIFGHVKAQSTGKAVAGVSVTLTGSGTPPSCSSVKTTNTNGIYLFTGLKTGSYTLTPAQGKSTCTSFTPSSMTVNLTKLAEVNFTCK